MDDHNLALGEIAYDGFHAGDDNYKGFKKLSSRLQERWAQAAKNAREAETKAGSVDVESMREKTRAAHAELRAKERAKYRYYCWAPDFFEVEDGVVIESFSDGFAACDYAYGLYSDASLCTVFDKILIHVRDLAGTITRFQVNCVINAEDAPPEEPDVTT